MAHKQNNWPKHSEIWEHKPFPRWKSVFYIMVSAGHRWIMNKYCAGCGVEIPVERLEILPDTTHCTHCAEGLPRIVQFDPNVVCAQASSTGRNGFARND